jgi:hypothetical protein
VASWADVERIASGLPDVVEERGTWRVHKRPFVWERPLRKRDLEELGDSAPSGPILGARVADEGDKQALIASDPDAIFTIRHFDGYSAVLVQLDMIGVDALTEVITDAWLVQAPKRIAKQFLADRAARD